METFVHVRTIAPVRVGAQGRLLSFPIFGERVPFFNQFRINLLIINFSYCLYESYFISRNITKKKALYLVQHEVLPRVAHGSGIGDVSGIGK